MEETPFTSETNRHLCRVEIHDVGKSNEETFGEVVGAEGRGVLVRGVDERRRRSYLLRRQTGVTHYVANQRLLNKR